MKFYRIDLRTDKEGSLGFDFCTSAQQADKILAKFRKDNAGNEPACSAEVIHVTPTRAGILRVLNTYAGHPDNG